MWKRWMQMRVIFTITAMIMAVILVANSDGLITYLIRMNAAAISLEWRSPWMRIPLIIGLHLAIMIFIGWCVWKLAKLIQKYFSRR